MHRRHHYDHHIYAHLNTSTNAHKEQIKIEKKNQDLP